MHLLLTGYAARQLHRMPASCGDVDYLRHSVTHATCIHA